MRPRKTPTATKRRRRAAPPARSFPGDAAAFSLAALGEGVFVFFVFFVVPILLVPHLPRG
jgi:hypothetical protein